MAQSVKSTDEIRQIQALMILMMCAKPMGKLHELFEHVLRIPAAPMLARMTPMSDASPDGIKDWLEKLIAKGGFSVAEQATIDWQKNSANMQQAIAELEEVQKKVGFKIAVQKK